MITVYFESDSHAEVVALFETDELYQLALPSLQEAAEREGMRVTESAEQPRLTDGELIEITASTHHETLDERIAYHQGLTDYRDHYAAPQPSLPSDEEIARKAQASVDNEWRGLFWEIHKDFAKAFEMGAKWIRTKAQGGSND